MTEKNYDVNVSCTNLCPAYAYFMTGCRRRRRRRTDGRLRVRVRERTEKSEGHHLQTHSS